MLTVLLVLAALAQNPSGQPSRDRPVVNNDRQPDAEIIVFDELEIARRRAHLDQTLMGLGYQAHRRTRDGTLYRPDVAWHPTVVVHDEGFVVLKRSRIRMEPLMDGRTPLRWLSCVPSLGIGCVRGGGPLFVSPRKLSHKKSALLDEIDPSLDAWREAITTAHTQRRLDEDLPDLIDSIWFAGVTDDPKAAVIEDMSQRKLTLMNLWISRTCTPEGQIARSRITDFFSEVVQTSQYPITEEERRHAEASNQCGATLGELDDNVSLDANHTQQ